MRRITVTLDIGIECEDSNSTHVSEFGHDLIENIETMIPTLNVWDPFDERFVVAKITRAAVQRASEQ